MPRHSHDDNAITVAGRRYSGHAQDVEDQMRERMRELDADNADHHFTETQAKEFHDLDMAVSERDFRRERIRPRRSAADRARRGPTSVARAAFARGDRPARSAPRPCAPTNRPASCPDDCRAHMEAEHLATTTT